MTMGFDVADKKMLEPVKPGDKVRFHVEVKANVRRRIVATLKPVTLPAGLRLAYPPRVRP